MSRNRKRKCQQKGTTIQNTHTHTYIYIFTYSLNFANDQVLLAKDHDDQEYMARKLKEELKKWGLAINLEKTKHVCMGERKEILKFNCGEEIKPYTECNYLSKQIDQLGDNIKEIKHRICQKRKVINILSSIWWHKNITKNRMLYI